MPTIANMKKVYIASPVRGINRDANLRYLDDCISNSLERGEAPLAPHAYLTRFLSDNDTVQRLRAISIGQKFLSSCQLLAVYTDYGISEGMQMEMDVAKALNIRIELRKLHE